MSPKSRKKRVSGLRILLTAALFSAFCGAIELGEPLEDLMRGGRNMLHQRDADGKVVIVGIDDKTLDRLSMDFSEKNDAEVIERLFQAGVNRVYFDRVFRDINDQAGSATLIETLKRHPGRVFFGSHRNPDQFNQNITIVGPAKRYLPYANVASLTGYSTPFGLSSQLVLSGPFNGQTIPSISASIAGRHDVAAGDDYRPDWAIRARSIPTISYLDVLDGKLRSGDLRGKDVVVGPQSSRIPDTHRIVGQGWVPGVYFHAIGAQTLREGNPFRASWLFPFAFALALAWLTVRTRSLATAIRHYSTVGVLALVVPFITDYLFITVDYLPAFLLYGIVAYRSHTFKAIDSAAEVNADSRMPNILALRNQGIAPGQAVAALTVKNYDTIRAAYPDIAPGDLLQAIARPIMLTDPDMTVFHEDNTLYWKLPTFSNRQLSDHLDGLSKLLASIKLNEAVIDLDCAIGVDSRPDETLAQRITAARIAASQAAASNLTHAFYTATEVKDAQWRLSLMSELDDAISNNVLTVAYQPQLDLATGKIRSAEALVRWNHPVRGPIPPIDFIEHAEATNRIDRLTYYVLERALRDTASLLPKIPDFAIGVNLSARMLSNPDLLDQIMRLLADAGVSPRHLKVEITETAALNANSVAARNLEALSAAGASISIDDYGTGNATLEYLRSIPFDELKIDRQFVKDITTSKRDMLLVQSTINLAHALGHSVTAEGIESDSTLKLLKRLGCDYAQGYHIARPMPFEEMKVFINQYIGAKPRRGNSAVAFG